MKEKTANISVCPKSGMRIFLIRRNRQTGQLVKIFGKNSKYLCLAKWIERYFWPALSGKTAKSLIINASPLQRLAQHGMSEVIEL